MVGVIAISDLIELKLVELSFERKCSIIETISLQQHTSQRQKARLYGGRIIGRCSGNRRGKEISKHTSYVSQWVSLSLSLSLDRSSAHVHFLEVDEREETNESTGPEVPSSKELQSRWISICMPTTQIDT